MVVMDEVLGQWLTLLGRDRNKLEIVPGGFLLFRIFDIWKPWPIRRLEIAGGNRHSRRRFGGRCFTARLSCI